MSKKYCINFMSNDELIFHYKNISPITTIFETVNGKNVPIPYFLREFTCEELTEKSYIWNKEEDKRTKVDMEKLIPLEEIKTLHKYGYYGLFKPSIAEVISQIPTELLSKTAAFEITYSPETAADFNLYKEEFDAGYHVAKVQLYAKRF